VPPAGELRREVPLAEEKQRQRVWAAVCFSGGPRPFIGPQREGEAVVQRSGNKVARWWSGRSVGVRSGAGDEIH
jgi:hypothetical protein